MKEENDSKSLKYSIGLFVKKYDETKKDPKEIFTYRIVDTRENNKSLFENGEKNRFDYSIKKIEDWAGAIKNAIDEFVFEEEIFP